jgi:acetyltransferase-like isoleucine patch superfamily enzyme
VGISSAAIICCKSISIGNNVKIGGNTVIYDSDFHSLNFASRRTKDSDIPEMKPVIIEDDVFIGAHVTILKGVHIGARAIIAAGSVITKSIPVDETWGGNPAKRIR